MSFIFCAQDAVRIGTDRGATDATKALLVLLGNQFLRVRCFTVVEQAGLAGVMLVGNYNRTIVAVFLGFKAHVFLVGIVDTITSATDKQ